MSGTRVTVRAFWFVGAISRCTVWTSEIRRKVYIRRVERVSLLGSLGSRSSRSNTDNFFFCRQEPKTFTSENNKHMQILTTFQRDLDMEWYVLFRMSGDILNFTDSKKKSNVSSAQWQTRELQFKINREQTFLKECTQHDGIFVVRHIIEKW